jgi:outer membrane protein insertion porin family
MERSPKQSRHLLYVWLTLGFCLWLPFGRLYAQTTPLDFVPAPAADSLIRQLSARLVQLQKEGFYLACLRQTSDSLWIEAGPRITLDTVIFENSGPLPPKMLYRTFPVHAGQVLTTDHLKAGLEQLARHYAEAGYPLMRVRIAHLDLHQHKPDRLLLVLQIDPGPRLYLDHILLRGAKRTRPNFVARVLGLQKGQWLRPFDPKRMATRLEATGLFRRVEPPALYLSSDTTAVLVVALEEAPLGTFDFLLGYAPESKSLMGSGYLRLQHVQGVGRQLEVQLERLPSSVSRFRLEAGDPFFLGWPLALRIAFAGRQQDSTYNQQHYRLTLGYRMPSGLELTGSWRWETTQPGVAGAHLALEPARIGRSTANLAGLGLSWQPFNPATTISQGILLNFQAERGTKTFSPPMHSVSDTLRSYRRVRQHRLEASVRFYQPLTAQLLLVGGGDLRLLQAEHYEASDLYRLGGARSLRGYDEEQFVGHQAIRLLLETRWLLHFPNYAFAFFDLGYIAAPPGFMEANPTHWHPGYGIGVQWHTQSGLLNLSYALNPKESWLDGRLHLQLSLGL